MVVGSKSYSPEARSVIDLTNSECSRGSFFPINQVVAGVRFVVQASVSLHACSRIFAILNHIAGLSPYDAPSLNTVRNWILRVGLFLLLNIKPRADWIWIADHSHSIGTEKVLVVLGISLEVYLSLKRPLQHTDVTVLDLRPVERSNGEVVESQFEMLAARVGEPLGIVSDAGSDLTSGIRAFQETHPGVIDIYDVVHMVSRKIEKIMNANPEWDTFRKDCCRCANSVRQSKLAHLKPPCPRTKARYMSFEREVFWGARALWVLDRVKSGNLTDRQKERLTVAEVQKNLRWLRKYRRPLRQWELLSLIGEQVIASIRTNGYGATTIPALNEIKHTTNNRVCRKFIDDVIDTIRPTCTSSAKHTRLLASSEAIESLFGKAKHMLGGGKAPTNSFTGFLLSMVACTVSITPELVREALATVKQTQMEKWTAERFGRSVHHDRKTDLTPTPTEQKLRKPELLAIENY